MAISIAFWHLSPGKDSGHFSKDDFFADLQIFPAHGDNRKLNV